MESITFTISNDSNVSVPKRSLEVPINEDGAFVFVIRNWLNPDISMIWLNGLIQHIPWGKVTYNFSDKIVTAPRLLFGLMDENMLSYETGIPTASWDKFNDRDLDKSYEWIEKVRNLRDSIAVDPQLLEIIGKPLFYDSCWLNYYRDGRDSIAPHSDKEVNGELNVVSGLSLGATRTFTMRNKRTGRIVEFPIHNGDFMMMGGNCQELWTHAINKEYHIKTPRISLTFRQLQK